MAKKSNYKTMMVREEVWRKLDKLKRAGESYSDLLARLCDIAVEVDTAGGITSKFAGDLMTAIGKLAHEKITESQQVSPPTEKAPQKTEETVSERPKSETAQSDNTEDAVTERAYEAMIDAFNNQPTLTKSSGLKSHNLNFDILGGK